MGTVNTPRRHGDADERPTWRSVAGLPRFRAGIIGTSIALVGALVLQARFLAWNEDRSGVVLPDPLLELFAPRDLSMLTFGLIYASLAVALLVLARRPALLLPALMAYALLATVRVAFMYCVPLDPPPHIIPLRDPLVEVVGTGRTLTRDLFFSGHTATLFLLFLAVPRGLVRGLLLAACAVVAALTVWQHTHYVIDVLVAPFFAYGCLQAARWIFRCTLLRPAVVKPAAVEA